MVAVAVAAAHARGRGDILVVGFIADILVNISIPGRREGFQITFYVLGERTACAKALLIQRPYKEGKKKFYCLAHP